MPRLLGPTREPKVPAPNPVRWTRRQCDAIREAGVLSDRYELIDGEIISKMGQNPPHPFALGELDDWLAAVFGSRHVRIQAPIDLRGADPEHNEPEPDIAVTRHPRHSYLNRHPTAEDLLLIVEVSDTTVRFDRITKAQLYAEGGVEEYWVLDMPGRQMFVHRRPGPAGYGEVTVYSAEEQVATLARPGSAVRVADLLPPPA
jgi:Uma2 family endonuclease